MPEEKVKTFEQAKQELDRILNEFDRDQVNLDTLVPRLKRAKELIEFCTKRIKQIDAEAKEIVKSIDVDSAEPAAAPVDAEEQPPF
jgi:exodeoxyribonuclease VII small subunit